MTMHALPSAASGASRPRRRLVAVVLAAVVAAALPGPRPAAEGPDPAGGPRSVVRELVVRGERQRYAVVLPGDYDSTRAWPGVVFLHGAGECGNDLRKPLSIGLVPAMGRHPERWRCVVIVPQKPRVDVEWEEREDLVLAALADARRAFPIDSDRVALTGFSQGGHGVWLIGARHPELWSCLVPIAAYGRALTVAARVASLPVWAFHGLQDDVVDPRDSRRIVEAIQRERASRGLPSGGEGGARMTLYPGENHGCWDDAYAEPELAVWMLSRTRSPQPSRNPPH